MPTREREVADLRAAGKSQEESARILGISAQTVHGHRRRASQRLAGRLSRRQRQVVSCLALALTIDDVARHLGIARGTAVEHRTLAALALGLSSVVELTHYAIVHEWVRPGDALSPVSKDAALRRIVLEG